MCGNIAPIPLWDSDFMPWEKSSQEFRVHERRIFSAALAPERCITLCGSAAFTFVIFLWRHRGYKPPSPQIFSRRKPNAIFQENWVNKQ